MVNWCSFPQTMRVSGKGQRQAHRMSAHLLADRAVLRTFLAQNAANIIAPVLLITNVC